MKQQQHPPSMPVRILRSVAVLALLTIPSFALLIAAYKMDNSVLLMLAILLQGPFGNLYDTQVATMNWQLMSYLAVVPLSAIASYQLRPTRVTSIVASCGLFLWLLLGAVSVLVLFIP